ncbi:hypothetical protein, partial [Salmonella enterica]|uniref:hypothetical protein n=1 Tax=Salmonella enterica TaxID=28901 RepID=UPI003D2CB05D
TKILKETGHYHIEFSTAAADKEAAAEKKAQDDAIRRQAVFSQANDQLDAQIAAAKRASLTDLGAIAQLNEQQLRAE